MSFIMAETEDAVRKFIKGDEESFDRIVRYWERKVYSLAWRMLGNNEDAQDVVQETFFSVFRSLRELREPASFSSWLYRIALNHCRARQKARGFMLSLSDPLPVREARDGGAANFGTAGVQNSAAAVENADIIRKALDGLSEDHRTAIILKEYLGLSLEELARVMECPLSTAKSRLYNGLREVQRNLKRLGFKVSEE
jgi:RNA polymerase sigma-70 factor (ECF subfamily)